MGLAHFAFKQGSSHTSMEKHNLWTARLSIVGTRTIVMVDTEDAKQRMRLAGNVGKTARDYMHEIGLQGAQAPWQQAMSISCLQICHT